MGTRWKGLLWQLPVALAVLLLVGITPSFATDKKAGGAASKLGGASRSGDEGAPAAVKDPAFDHYVDLSMLATAWNDLDAPLLCDLGLQLAEGERVLLRPHKAITADQVLGIALKVATEKNDAATLKRLAKAADTLGKKELGDKIGAASKLGAGSRAADAALALSVDRTSVDAFTQYKDALARITTAKLAGDAKALEAIAKEAPKMEGLPDAQRQYLTKAATEAKEGLPKDADPAVAALSKLASESRGPPKPVTSKTYPDQTIGCYVRYDSNKQGLTVTGFFGGGPNPLGDGSTLDPGDVILMVGNHPANYQGKQLAQLIQQAYNESAPFIVVKDGQSGATSSIPLP
jgi:hypothetical protein